MCFYTTLRFLCCSREFQIKPNELLIHIYIYIYCVLKHRLHFQHFQQIKQRKNCILIELNLSIAVSIYFTTTFLIKLNKALELMHISILIHPIRRITYKLTSYQIFKHLQQFNYKTFHIPSGISAHEYISKIDKFQPLIMM